MAKASRFPGFPREALQFFRDLEQNNDRDWFQARKDVYERAIKAPTEALVEALNAELLAFAPDYVTEPRKAIYRIYRDTRFSADKTPYKTHTAASFIRRGLEKHAGAGFYFGVSHKEVEVAGGVYLPPPGQLLVIRGHLADKHAELRRLLAARKLREAMGEVQGTKLTRVPKGWPGDHPAADLLRAKQWYFYVLLDAEIATTAELLPEVARRFRLMAPVIDFFNSPLVARRKKAAAQESLWS